MGCFTRYSLEVPVPAGVQVPVRQVAPFFVISHGPAAFRSPRPLPSGEESGARQVPVRRSRGARPAPDGATAPLESQGGAARVMGSGGRKCLFPGSILRV